LKRTTTHLCAALVAAAVFWPAARAAASAVRARVSAHHEACAGEHLAPTSRDAATIESATLCLLNRERALRRLAPMRANPALERIAVGQAWDMVRGDYFADHSLRGQSPMERIIPALQPARIARTGQNIGWGIGQDATPEGIVRAWMNSPPHREIILTGDYNEAGVGMAPRLPLVLAAGRRGATYSLDLSALGH
jgi:uncharacterized protein YkwD